VSEAFVVHRYDRQRSGQPERRGAVVATIANDLLPFFALNRVTVIERITHELVGKLAAHLAGLGAVAEPDIAPWPELDGRLEVTLTDAAALPGTSRSTVKRWRAAGLLPSWRRDDLDGQVRVRVDELRAAYLRGRAAAADRRVNQATTAANKLDVLKMILNFAEANGIDLHGSSDAGRRPHRRRPRGSVDRSERRAPRGQDHSDFGRCAQGGWWGSPPAPARSATSPDTTGWRALGARRRLAD
jgi:hypothetical protein